MNRTAVRWIVGAVAVLALAPVSVMFGTTLLPSWTTAGARGTLVPWLLTWGLISMTALIAVGLAGFLTMIGMSKVRSQ
jgi:hypothetical protein